MKHLYTASFFCFTFFSAAAQLSVGGGYQLSAPLQKMNSNINPGHSFFTNVLYRLPDGMRRFSVGVEGGIGTYAQRNRQQTFVFTDGSRTVTNVNYSSNLWQAAAVFRYDLLRDKLVVPYLSAKLGYTRFYSAIRIDDPLDTDGCRPLDSQSLLGDGTFSTGAGAGFRLDMAAFSRIFARGSDWIDIGIHHTAGGNLRYINTRKIMDGASAQPSDGAEPLTMQFINVNTQNIHNHQVAEVFTSPLRLLQVNVSYFKSF